MIQDKNPKPVEKKSSSKKVHFDENTVEGHPEMTSKKPPSQSKKKSKTSEKLSKKIKESEASIIFNILTKLSFFFIK